MWPFKWCNHHDHTEAWQKVDTDFKCNVDHAPKIKTCFVRWCCLCDRRETILGMGGKFYPEGWTKGDSLAKLPAPLPTIGFQ